MLNSTIFKKIDDSYYLTRRGQKIYGGEDPYLWNKTDPEQSESVSTKEFCIFMGINPDERELID